MNIIRLFNAGQIPALASGYRSLIVKEGRTKAQLLDWTTLETAKIDLRELKRMKPEPARYDWRRVKRCIKARLRYRETTKFIKEVLNHKETV